MFTCTAYGQESREQELKYELELDALDELWKELEMELGEYLPGFHWRDILGRMEEGQGAVGLSGLMGGIWRYLWREVFINLNLLGRLLILAVIAALLKNLQRAFNLEHLPFLVQSIIFLVLISIALHSFKVAIGIGREAINQMVDIMLALLPLLLLLLASLGSLASAAIFHPLIIFTIHFFSTLIRDVVFPLIFLSTALSMVHHLATQYPVNRLANLFRDITIWIMSFSLTIFIGITAVQGVAGTVADAVSLRTLRFTASIFIPVLGGMLAEAVETVLGASLILKNSISVAGVLLLFLFTVFPLVKIFVIMMVYKVAAAVVQPLGETELSEGLNTLGNCLGLVMASVAIVCLMFIIAVTIIVGAGNAVVMFR